MAEQTCVIGRGIAVTGNISGSESLVIEGRVQGTIALGSDLTVREDAVVHADIEVESLAVDGELRGNLQASKNVFIGKDATVVGSIRAPRITIEENARYSGRIEMDVKLPAGVKVP